MSGGIWDFLQYQKAANLLAVKIYILVSQVSQVILALQIPAYPKTRYQRKAFRTIFKFIEKTAEQAFDRKRTECANKNVCVYGNDPLDQPEERQKDMPSSTLPICFQKLTNKRVYLLPEVLEAQKFLDRPSDPKTFKAIAMESHNEANYPDV